MFREQNIDFAILTETWYSDEKQHQFETSDLNQNGYKISVCNRRNKIGGGVALSCRSEVNMRKLLSGIESSFEYGLWRLIFKTITIHCVGVYRPPNTSTPTEFVSEFFKFLEDIVSKHSNIIIMGDFNLHLQDNSSAVSDFNNSLFALGLQQHVDVPTHIHGQSFDLVITEHSNGIDIRSCEPGLFVSDHCAVKVVTRIKKENIVSKSISFRNFKNMNQVEFANDISQMAIPSESVESFVDSFENQIENLLD